jgi:hypothetical protein
MPFYRILQNIYTDIDHRLERGGIQRLTMKPEHIAVLIDRGAISQIATPPLDILPDWGDRAKKLAKRKIFTVEDILEVLEDNPAPIQKLFELSDDDVLQWRQELITNWLVVKE